MKPAAVGSPFPGLRPFREEEEHLFFGRESQVDAMIDKLAATRFLAVVGTSGCGKSSLVNCGLRPALHRGLMTHAGSAWRMAQFRPGGNAIRALAAALAQPGVLFGEPAPGTVPLLELVESTLRMSKLGLIDIAEQARLPVGTALLLVVDQFEELFRYRQLGASDVHANHAATALVNLLLEVRERPDCPIHVVLTMRSDFLGDCTQFPGLAEAINSGQYLVPRLTRDERRAAIAGPTAVAGAQISPVLLTRLVNDVGDNPDQLSILQHALNRTWARWERDGGHGALELAHYEAIGTMAHALDQHAERAHAELSDERQRGICEKVFKALTDKAADPRGVRRPTPFATLCALADATPAEVTAVIDVFRKPSRSFLMPPAGEPLEGDTVIDISHESLMRVWERLRIWADEEAQSAQHYRRLAETARLHAVGSSSLWRDPELQLALDWREQTRPNEAWALRYHPGHAAAMAFLERSRTERDAERERELQAEREAATARALAASARVKNWAIGIILVLASVAGYFALVASRESEEANQEREVAKEQRRIADAQRDKAEQALSQFRIATAEKESADKLLEAEAKDNPRLRSSLQDKDRPTVYIQIQSAEQKPSADRLRQLLPQKGYKAPGIERVSIGPKKAELRYFRDSEKAAATELAGLLSKNSDIGEVQVKRVTGYETKSTQLPFELWYGSPTLFVVAGSFAQSDGANRMLARLTQSGFEARIINTGDYPNLRAGFSAVVLGPYWSEALATAQKQKVSGLVPDAYVKSGW